MDCGCLSISLSVCLALTVRRQAGPGPELSTQTGRTHISDWSTEASGGPLLLFDQLIDLLTLVCRTCVHEFNFRIHFSETCVYRNDVESQDPNEGLRARGNKIEF